jgi:hypothetical protein
MNGSEMNETGYWTLDSDSISRLFGGSVQSVSQSISPLIVPMVINPSNGARYEAGGVGN